MIMNGEKTDLPSVRNIGLRTVKTKTEKINQVLTYISTNNITESNELINAEAKLVCEKIDSLQKARKKKKIKTRIGNSSGNADKNLRKRAKTIKQKKKAGLCRDKKEKASREKIRIKLEEIN